MSDDVLERSLRTARALVDLGHPIEDVCINSLIPSDLRDKVRQILEREETFTLNPVTVISRKTSRTDWLAGVDRSGWHYWPRLRQFLITKKGFPRHVVRDLDDSSDKILRQFYPPESAQFDIRGLVLGYVQSGKTSNYTALIAKAADAGYRLVIVLSGIDNGLRRQTNLRLKKELVGYQESKPDAVELPPRGLRWHEFTRESLDGDFQPGFANHAALQGEHPVLLVVKKNGDVLRRLLGWLDSAPLDVRRQLPVLVVDDEADQASIDTRGTAADPTVDIDDIEPPSVINGLIRDLLQKFERKIYVAYTATPFANILIPHDAVDLDVGSDLYPKDFIIDLPKPHGYFGVEELFGRMNTDNPGVVDRPGLGVVRIVPDKEIEELDRQEVSKTLKTAVIDFLLAGAARARRRESDFPATMLIHTSRLTDDQSLLRERVQEAFAELRDAWRYHRESGIYGLFKDRWEDEFRQLTRQIRLEDDCSFGELEDFISPFLEAVKVREVNSVTGEALDYEREPNLKAIAVGGNRLSRGLTLEGLLVSYFVRRSPTYDTLMQMGRWFGFREGYEDLTRIYMTSELKRWFTDLSLVEMQLREDIAAYEDRGLTPHELGLRIKEHPTMQITSPLKRRFSRTTILGQSFSGAFQQTFKFPFADLSLLKNISSANKSLTEGFLNDLSDNVRSVEDGRGPTFKRVAKNRIVSFLREFAVYPNGGFSPELIASYIDKVSESGELEDWTVAVCGRRKGVSRLGTAEWDVPYKINQISRTRIKYTDSLGVITGSTDELTGLSDHERELAEEIVRDIKAQGKKKSVNSAAREIRSPTQGLLLIYPISKYSGYEIDDVDADRQPLFSDPAVENSIDLIGLAVSFPYSNVNHKVESFLEGSVGWRVSE